jgi:quinol monooxygenase YgiN
MSIDLVRWHVYWILKSKIFRKIILKGGAPLFFYKLKLVIKDSKIEEFVECLLSLLEGLRKENGSHDVSFYKDLEKENTYGLVGEWKTREAMEKHFKNKNFSVLIGAARVLSETFEMSVGDLLETGSFSLAKEKISLQ